MRGECVPLDIVDDFNGGPGDVVHVLAMRVFAEEAGGADDNVDAVYARRYRELGVLHCTPYI